MDETSKVRINYEDLFIYLFLLIMSNLCQQYANVVHACCYLHKHITENVIGGIYLARELNALCKCTCSAPEDKERLHSCPDLDPVALVCTDVPPGVQRALPTRKQTRRDSSFSLRSLVISMQFSTMPNKTETGLEHIVSGHFQTLYGHKQTVVSAWNFVTINIPLN